jgi:quinol monooxygenase YgiN
MSEIVGIGRVRFHDGGYEQYRRLCEQEFELIRDREPGTLQLDIFVNEAKTEAVFVERYTDSDALIAHGQNVAALSAEIVKTGTFEGEILGEVSDELRAAIGADGPVRLFVPLMSLRPEN